MRILHVWNQHRGRGGADVAVERTVQAARGAGLDVRTFVRDSRDLSPGVSGRVRALTGGVYARDGVRAFERELEECRPDVVHVHELYPLISPWILPRCLARGVPVVMSCSDYRFTCPITTHFHDGEVCTRCLGGREYRAMLTNCRGSVAESAAYALFGYVRRWFRLFERNVDRFIVPTDFVGRWLAENTCIPAERLVTVYPPVSIPDSTVDPAGGTYLAFAGRFAPGKGMELLTRAARRCGLPLKFAGNRDHLDCVEPSDDVEFVMADGREEVDAFYRGARIVVVPSTWLETFNLVAAEGMSHGLPVIASDIGGIAENVLHEETGLRFPPGDEDALVAALSRLWSDTELCRRFGRAGREHVVRKFGPEPHIRGVIALYEEVRTQGAATSAGLAGRVR